ncbi:UbiA prenyltransferase family [Mycena belliarum]|uniref:UbiA prenyltransferase family n=1 Tax=Mycena belliarum TaxID=1033014 RepID=A0AAD6TPW6_9AGAR|nr:UbiA prenyltransferase family [Mycena belliae]KAJ7082212.1 UbiA prenyltransferase family [Mycena belliae]
MLHFLKTLLLFSKSDVAPILAPSLAVAMVLAGPTDLPAFFTGFLWLELHLLTFEIKNQITGLEEDRLSKPDRPIVAGRISSAAAEILYLCVGTISVLYSVYHRVLLCSVIYMAAIICYNEGGMSRNWFLKSFLGSLGYVCYCWGTTVIFDHGKPLSRISVLAVAISGLLHTTTGHAQDFRDRPGDAAIGRKTLPLLLPARVARWSLALLMSLWTVALIRLWAPPLAVSALLALLCCTSAAKFIRDHSVEADRNSYWFYNMWLITAHMLPVFARIAAWRVMDPHSLFL